jgi:hypothetical protein
MNIFTKNKSLNGLALLAAAVLFSALQSCDVMDTKPFTSYDEETVWSSKSTADAFVNGTVGEVLGLYINGNQTSWEEKTNNVAHNNGTAAFVRDEIDRYDNSGGFGNFGNIRRCNLIISKAEEYKGKGLSDSESKDLVAKGKLLRALIYYAQARTIGRFVYIDKVLAATDTINNGLALPTTKSTTESYTYIINDIQAAIPDLPEAAAAGELQRNLAYAFLSEIALQGAAYETDAAKRKEWLKLSVSAADNVKGSLSENYGDMFNDKAPNSPEIIFAVYRSKINTQCSAITPLQNLVPLTTNDRITQNNCAPLFLTDGGAPFWGWLWWSPTQNLVDCYDVIDQNTGKAVKWNESSQFKDKFNISPNIPEWVVPSETGEVIYSGATADDDASISSIIYSNRDNRFYETFYYDGATQFGEEIRLTVNGNLWRKCNGALGPHIGTTNYYYRKGIYNVEPRVESPAYTDYHFVVMRYGRILLNKAEALLWLSAMGESAYTEAVEICNQTRTVHGKLPAASCASIEEAWQLYMKERRIELTLENDYYWSLLRWGKHGGYANAGENPGGKIIELTIAPQYIEIAHDRKSFYVGNVTHGNAQLRNFREDRRYLLPIPQGQIERNPNLGPQNPGW